jgi:NAD(P)-dependent dehydrogenase (short-subunit alcohol dehydrogenase family)
VGFGVTTHPQAGAQEVEFLNLHDKVAIVTGGGSGIGLATARILAARGAAVAVFDLDLSRLEQQSGLSGHRVDVTSEDEVSAGVAAVFEQHGRIDILVNSAVAFRWGHTVDTLADDWDLMLAVNLKGTWLMGRQVAAVMKEQGWGSIVNIGSNMGMKGIANQMAYSASKGGVIALTRSMAVDLGPSGIRVNCINPGHTHTPLADWAAAGLGLDEEVTVREKYPLQRVGEAEELGRVIAFIASDDNSFMTGAIVPVDGGYTA